MAMVRLPWLGTQRMSWPKRLSFKSSNSCLTCPVTLVLCRDAWKRRLHRKSDLKKEQDGQKRTGSHNPQEHPDSDPRTQQWPLAQVCHPRKQTLTWVCGALSEAVAASKGCSLLMLHFKSDCLPDCSSFL